MKKYTDQELRNLIITRYTKPHHFGSINNPKVMVLKLDSPNCSDRLNLEIVLKNDKIQDLKFNGEACAIAVSAADLLIDQVLEKDRNEVEKILKNYDALIQNQNEVDWENLQELAAFKNIHKQKGRIVCATLFSNGLKKIIEKN